MPAPDHARKVINFLVDIGLPAVIDEDANGFIDHVRIAHGTLRIASKALTSNILHEAGHIALLPKQFRHLAHIDIDDVIRTMLDNVKDLDPDHPLARAVMQTSDPEVTAWAWAVGKHLELPEDVIILDHEYEGDGAMIKSCLRMGGYLGINGLMHAGYCKLRSHHRGTAPVYPELAMWLQH